MSDKFSAAVEAIRESAVQYIENRQFVFVRINPREVLHRLYLGIHWIPPTGQAAGFWHASDTAIVKLVGETPHDCSAFDLALQIAGDRLVRNEQMPEELRVFAALHLVGQLERPKDEKRSITWLRSIYLYAMAQNARVSFGLTLTRSDEKQGEHDSACDAVVRALAQAGHHTTYRAVKELCVGTGKSNVQLRQDYQNWVAATVHSVNEDEMGLSLFQTSWLCVGAKSRSPT